MKIVVLGANGMLGHSLVPRLLNSGHNVMSLDLPVCDITDYQNLKENLSAATPDLVINIAAYTDVDGAETNRELAYSVNSTGADNVAKVCAELSARCFYISTDYVFDGTKTGKYEVDDTPCPLSVYGDSKHKGEIATLVRLPKTGLVIRTSWLYGHGGKNFPFTMLKLANAHKDLKVIDDQIGAPTYTDDLSQAISKLAMINDVCGIVHATNSDCCSWYEFAKTIFEKTNRYPNSLIPCKTCEYPSAAKRPLNSRLSERRLSEFIGHPLPTWDNAISRFLMTIENYDTL